MQAARPVWGGGEAASADGRARSGVRVRPRPLRELAITLRQGAIRRELRLAVRGLCVRARARPALHEDIQVQQKVRQRVRGLAGAVQGRLPGRLPAQQPDLQHLHSTSAQAGAAALAAHRALQLVLAVRAHPWRVAWPLGGHPPVASLFLPPPRLARRRRPCRRLVARRGSRAAVVAAVARERWSAPRDSELARRLCRCCRRRRRRRRRFSRRRVAPAEAAMDRK
mmetsp:Transcript_29289/g.95170  ORF Transcript_29289/g.95170 Transcript_29289/m.95170 type:complete len:225 (+) Transcript_29289:260-934(+)